MKFLKFQTSTVSHTTKQMMTTVCATSKFCHFSVKMSTPEHCRRLQ